MFYKYRLHELDGSDAGEAHYATHTGLCGTTRYAPVESGGLEVPSSNLGAPTKAPEIGAFFGVRGRGSGRRIHNEAADPAELGHGSPQLTEPTYGRRSESAKQTEAARVESAGFAV